MEIGFDENKIFEIKEIKSYTLKLLCEKCRSEMEYTYDVISDFEHKIQYKHKCTSCGYTTYVYNVYPYTKNFEVPLNE